MSEKRRVVSVVFVDEFVHSLAESCLFLFQFHDLKVDLMHRVELFCFLKNRAHALHPKPLSYFKMKNSCRALLLAFNNRLRSSVIERSMHHHRTGRGFDACLKLQGLGFKHEQNLFLIVTYLILLFSLQNIHIFPLKIV